MSNIIRRYKGVEDGILEVIAMMGGDEYGKGIQFYIESGESVVLSERQVIDLIITLLKRLGLKEGYSATDTSKFELEGWVVMPDGSIKLLNEPEDSDYLLDLSNIKREVENERTKTDQGTD